MLKQRTWTRFAAIFDLIMTFTAKGNQVSQLISVEIIAIKFAIWRNVMDSVIIFLFATLFPARLALESISFSSAFSLRPPIWPTCISVFTISIPLTIFASFQYALSRILTFLRAIVTFALSMRWDIVSFPAAFTYMCFLISNCAAMMRTKLPMFVFPRFKLFSTGFTCAYFGLRLKCVMAIGATEFSALGRAMLKGFPAIEAFGIMGHSNECPFVAHSQSACNTSGILFAVNYSTARGI